MESEVLSRRAVDGAEAGDGCVVRAIDACLARIVARDPAIGAWAYVGAPQARAQARRIDALDRRTDLVDREVGVLHGVPIGVKDVIATADMPTAFGHRANARRMSPDDAECVRRARAAGAIVVGKTSTAEFALSAPPATRHPSAPMRSPGGSSAGSAAAVAAGMTPIALATQTGGSTIRPASYCGVIGFKPSFGLINRRGMMPLSPSLDTIAVIARSVDWTAKCVDAIADRRLAPVAARALHVGLYAASEAPPHPLVAAALQNAAAAFASIGATIRQIEPQPDDVALRDDHATIVFGEAHATLFRYLDHPASLRAATRRLFAAPPPSPAMLAAAGERAARARADVERWFDDVDIVLAPSVTGPAPRRGCSGDPTPCIVWTLLHLPCLTLPTGVCDDGGLPIGVQLIARPGADALLIAAARVLESAIDARHGKPAQ